MDGRGIKEKDKRSNMNLEAERGTLSAFINLEDFAHTLPFKITEEDFSNVTNKTIAKAVLQLVNSGQKLNKNLIVSTARTLAIDNFDEQTKDGQTLDEIIALKPSLEEATTYIRQLKKESMKRAARSDLKNLMDYIQTTDDPLSAILTKFEDTVLSVTSSADFAENQGIKLADIIDRELDFFGNNPGSNGLDIGMPHWQERIGGIANGLVHCIIATNKTGKSNVGMNAAFETAKHLPVLYIDTEMDESIVATRIFSILTKLPTNLLKLGHWNNPEHDDHKFWNRVQQGKEEYKKLNITYIKAAGKQVVDMIPAMRRWVIQNNVASEGKFPQGLIIYDYVKLADFNDLKRFGLQEFQLLGLNMSALKDFCNKYKVPCLTFGQTNREDDSTINCLGASKRIADLVDSVSLFKTKTDELLVKDPNGSHLMRVFVSRHGPGTAENEHIQMQYDKLTGQIGELGIFTFKQKEETEEREWTGKRKPKKTHNATAQEILDGEGL